MPCSFSKLEEDVNVAGLIEHSAMQGKRMPFRFEGHVNIGFRHGKVFSPLQDKYVNFIHSKLHEIIAYSKSQLQSVKLGRAVVLIRILGNSHQNDNIDHVEESQDRERVTVNVYR